LLPKRVVLENEWQRAEVEYQDARQVLVKGVRNLLLGIVVVILWVLLEIWLVQKSNLLAILLALLIPCVVFFTRIGLRVFFSWRRWVETKKQKEMLDKMIKDILNNDP